jgi:hypothetical protein
MLLIGSRALALRMPQALSRKPLDFDWVCSKEEYDQWFKLNEHKIKPISVYSEMDGTKMIVKGEDNVICEFDFVQPGSSNDLLTKLVDKDPQTIDTSFSKVPSASLLFAIKDAHKYKKFNSSAANFWKHTIDWHCMKKLGCVIKDEHKEFHKLRQKESYAAQKHPKLNVSKDNFFKDDNITYKYDHDSIHFSAAANGIPAYTLYMKDNEPVLTDKNKFFAFSRDIQLAGVIEEATVLAIERSKVPYGDLWSDKQAWTFALAKVCTTITSGWFREFAFNNIFEVLKLYPENYWKKFQEDVKSGLVKPYTGSKY